MFLAKIPKLLYKQKLLPQYVLPRFKNNHNDIQIHIAICCVSITTNSFQFNYLATRLSKTQRIYVTLGILINKFTLLHPPSKTL